MRDGGVDLRTVEPQFRHDLARRGDLGFGHAAVGLRDVAHDLERRAKEFLADLERTRTGSAPARIDRLIVQVPDDGAEDGAHEAAEQEVTENRADDLSGEAHRYALL